MAKNRTMAQKKLKASVQNIGNNPILDAAVTKTVFFNIASPSIPLNTPITKCKPKTNNRSYWSKVR